MQSSSLLDTISKPEPQPAAPRKKRTLMIVDDEEGPRQSLRVIFKDEYNLLMASDGNRAIELARQNQVDVTISDIRMEGMSGVELLEHLKAIDPAIEVIMLTAFETVDTVRFALRLGACDYLSKPYEISAIRKAVASAIERRSLTEEIRNNTKELGELQKELANQQTAVETSRNRDEIYGSIIHDINSPLTVISGFMQLMNQRIGAKSKVEGEDLEFIKDRLKITTRQVTTCIEISRRYLDIIRKNLEEQAEISINEILGELEHRFLVDPNLKDNQFSVQRLAQDVSLRINRTDLTQMLSNLVVNALQCSPEKHVVEITARQLTEPLDLSKITEGPQDVLLNREGFRNSGKLISIAVRDTGPGIPAEIVPRIFNRGFTTKAPTEGTGLGLDIVSRLVQGAKGAIHLHTRMSQGTTFTLYLPTV
jgi:signal transduction histidine kinase